MKTLPSTKKKLIVTVLSINSLLCGIEVDLLFIENLNITNEMYHQNKDKISKAWWDYDEWMKASCYKNALLQQWKEKQKITQKSTPASTRVIIFTVVFLSLDNEFQCNYISDYFFFI